MQGASDEEAVPRPGDGGQATKYRKARVITVPQYCHSSYGGSTTAFQAVHAARVKYYSIAIATVDTVWSGDV